MENVFFFPRVIPHSRILFQHDIPYSLILPLHHCPQSASFRVTLTTAVNAIGPLTLSGLLFSFFRFDVSCCWHALSAF